MRRSKGAVYHARRKTLHQRMQRSFGLEYLEKRTVFASDLSSFLNEAGFRFAAPIEEIKSAQTPSFNRTVEVANEQLSLIQGDILEFEVPASLLLQLEYRDSYQLRVFYSENYFSYGSDTIASSRSEFIYSDIGSGNLLANAASSQQHALSDRQIDHDVHGMPASDNPSSTDAFSTILLASLTASSDFNGYVRILDSVQEPDQSATNAAIAGLPNEVRIEPRVTVPTALQDPGATLVKTIVVNRSATGVSVSTEDSRSESIANDDTELTDATDAKTTNASTSDSDEQKQGRSVVTLKTIDISLARRHETSRPWLRSSNIPNPTRQRESDFTDTTSKVMAIVSTSSTTSNAESALPRRREMRVPGTMLQPVEFLLAESVVDLDGETAMDTERIRATDQAMSYFAENAGTEILKDWGESSLIPVSLSPLNDAVSNPLVLANNRMPDWGRNNETMLAQLRYLVLISIHSGVASNKESWKNVVRSATESGVGQAMLATLASLAVQHRDMNAFGTKSAWEFVTKSAETRPV